MHNDWWGDGIKLLLSVVPVCDVLEEISKNIKSKAGSQWSCISKSQCWKLIQDREGLKQGQPHPHIKYCNTVNKFISKYLEDLRTTMESEIC
jgi:hypothetical protein